jgi:hypothetical protein
MENQKTAWIDGMEGEFIFAKEKKINYFSGSSISNVSKLHCVLNRDF